MAEVIKIDDLVIPPISPNRPLDLDISYYSLGDRLIVLFHGKSEPDMNVSVGDDSIELRVSMDESELLGFEIPDFTYAFLPSHPEYLDFAATAGVSTETIESIRWQISTSKRQRSAIDAILRQFAGVDPTL